MGVAIPLDPRRYGNLIARLQGHPEAVVRVAVQAEMNAEALEQQKEMYEGQMAAMRQGDKSPDAGKPNPPKWPASKRPAKSPAPAAPAS